MVSIAVAGLMLLTPSAPVPEKPPVPAQKADRNAAEQFARCRLPNGSTGSGRLRQRNRSGRLHGCGGSRSYTRSAA